MTIWGTQIGEYTFENAEQYKMKGKLLDEISQLLCI
jgi:hypothetical protein